MSQFSMTGEMNSSPSSSTWNTVMRAGLYAHRLQGAYAAAQPYPPCSQADHNGRRETGDRGSANGRRYEPMVRAIPQEHRRWPSDERDDHEHEKDGEDHERHAAVRSGHLAWALRIEARIPCAQPRRETDERQAHEKDADCGYAAQKWIHAKQTVCRDGQSFDQDEHGNEPDPELRPEK